MSHEIESIAWANEKPWHGLGDNVPQGISTDEMLKAAKLDWTVSKRPMYLQGGAKVPDNYALVRDSDDQVLDVCGNAYHPTQNHEAAEFFREFVEAGSAYIETAGSLKGGRHVWFLANLGADFKLAGDDELKSYLLCSTPHQQGKSMIFKFTNIRVVCNNTITAALREPRKSEVRRAHRSEFNKDAQDKVKDMLGIAREQAAEFAEIALKLSQTKVEPLRAAQLIATVFGDTELEHEEAFELIQTEGSKATTFACAALGKSPGADLESANGTLWGVLNAITYTTDHLLRKSTDSRLFNAWFGKEARIKEAAMATLLDEAA